MHIGTPVGSPSHHQARIVLHLLQAECDCPFLVKLHGAFQDAQNLYLLMDFVPGGELFTFMRKRRRALRESWARFYAAAVVVGFQYLGARSMIYRCGAAAELAIGACRVHAGRCPVLWRVAPLHLAC